MGGRAHVVSDSMQTIDPIPMTYRNHTLATFAKPADPILVHLVGLQVQRVVLLVV